MTLNFERIAVLGATGPTGRTLITELDNQGYAVRAVSRNRESMQVCFPEARIEKRVGDALDYPSLAGALEGCDLVVDCIGRPADRMLDHPVTARHLAQWLEFSGCHCLQVTSYWSFLPIRQLPVTESHPREAGPPWVRLRRETEDILRDAGAAIVHLPDFFGPHVHASTLQNALIDALQGKPMNWLGSADVARDYIYVPDAMRIVARLLTQPQAYGDDWILPGSGPLTAHRLAELLEELLQRKVKVRAASPWLLRLLSLFNKDLRGLMQIVPDYVKPISFDGAKLDRLLGEIPRTNYPEALRRTVTALRQSSA